MKVAFITNDGETISRHFGRAQYYLVVEVEDGEVKNREMRDKMGHSQFFAKEESHDHSEMHGMSQASHKKHGQMAQSISDCDILICGGMGMGAYQSMQSFNITPVVTDKLKIDEALQAYLEGNLQDQKDMLH
ncbi:MAG: NifB/NifX family molybdenum-iron cluster-binding protein [Chloroflexota bacterium]|jgi:predicted Fe-Mo cluster-binding NifX family protein|nr:NifB/NifX family molybdenum-iron cluster-binding protein [Chloroflexota bacterium]